MTSQEIHHCHMTGCDHGVRGPLPSEWDAVDKEEDDGKSWAVCPRCLNDGYLCSDYVFDEGEDGGAHEGLQCQLPPGHDGDHDLRPEWAPRDDHGEFSVWVERREAEEAMAADTGEGPLDETLELEARAECRS